MEITLEQVERLREKASVSYGQAKQALEYSGGNLLDALIYLEEKGIIPREEGAYFSTKGETPPPPEPEEPPAAREQKGKKSGVRVVPVRRGSFKRLLDVYKRQGHTPPPGRSPARPPRQTPRLPGSAAPPSAGAASLPAASRPL